jgi:Fe-S-cluster containining protein
MTEDPLSALCVACGLCCDGSLFRFLPLGPDPRSAYVALGLEVVEQSGQAAMPLPCPRLEGTACTVYAQRPGGCRRFRCHALHRVATGELSSAEALAAVVEARRRIARLRAALGSGVEPVVQRATTEALAGRLPEPALRALEDVQAWLDARLHWPLELNPGSPGAAP